jgi:hypothetical protein
MHNGRLSGKKFLNKGKVVNEKEILGIMRVIRPTC